VKSGFLYLIGQLRAGGSERQLFYLLQKMDRQRYRPAVAVWNYSNEDIYVEQIRALNVSVCPIAGAHSAAKLVAFSSLLRELEPEVVHSYSFFTNLAAWCGTFGTRAVALGSVRSDFGSAKQDCGFWLGRLSARWPRVQIFNNFAAAHLPTNFVHILSPQKAFVVRNGIDLDRFNAAPIPEQGPILIVGVGSLLPVKRWDRLLRAASVLQRDLKFLVQIVGEGASRSALESLAENLGLNGQLQLTGYEENIPSLLRKATFVVHTSDSEGCPNVIIEAMACGRAVVATAVGDVPLLVDDGKTGFVVRAGDDAALVHRMTMLISDRDLCRRMGEAGRAKAEREFGLDRLVGDTLAVYRAAGWKDSHL
jgi:glycosyltransferase involved in cell wall biosynthesis